MSLDAAFGSTEPTSFLGGSIPIPRGAAALARLSGAAVLPATSRWSERGYGIEMEVHPPLPEPDLPREDRDAWERAMTEGAVRWFEDFLRLHPDTVRLKELGRYTRD
jgi:lauroyl/myristoyl acyltransferase